MVPAWFPLRRVSLVPCGDLYGYSTSMRPAAIRHPCDGPETEMPIRQRCAENPRTSLGMEGLGLHSTPLPSICCPLAVRGLKTDTWKSSHPPLLGATAPLASQASRGLNLGSRPSPGGSGWVPRLTSRFVCCLSVCPAWRTVGRRAAQTDSTAFWTGCKRHRLHRIDSSM